MMFHKKFGYLISKYPAISHTFIQREIQALRLKGFVIHTASINKVDISHNPNSSMDEKEVLQTYYVKTKGGALSAIFEGLKNFVNRPLNFLKTLYLASKLANGNFKLMVKNIFYFSEALLIAAWMKKMDIHHLHVHFANPAATVALILAKLYPCSYSITIHGPDEFYNVSINNLKEKIEGAKFIICISDYARSQIMRLVEPDLWHKIDVIPLGVDPNLYEPSMYNESPFQLEILCVGRLTLNKGHHILIQAMKKIQKMGKKVLLNLVGDGPERLNLEKLVKNLGLEKSIIFKGALNQASTLETYKTADIFVLTSFAEGLPVVLMEAMSMEIPCVATAINGIPELIKHETNGLLVSPSNVEDTTNAIMRLVEDKSLRLKLGKMGRLTILERYNLKKNTDKLAEIFEQKIEWDLSSHSRKDNSINPNKMLK